ncbi:MAG TPA: hydantoinase B/oxoprolinase family protein, partial [Pseudobdellovibrionaceae bacterium]|nr:hydantoinase B/oxoprolinase family protein [Pseudobdellovibrionaceae bacterium]
MNLNFSNFQMLLESFLEEDSCLSTGSDDILFLKSKSPVLFGTLPESAKNTKKYLQLDAGDIVLLNDPYSGGGPTNEFTFIVITQAFAVPLYYSVKKIFGPLKTPADHIEKEGLRITPTPIKQKGEINISILDAIEVFPSTPVGFKNWILQELKQLSDWAQRFENAIGHCKTRSSKTFIKDFLEFSKSKTEVLLQNYSSFETKHEIKTASNETLKLELQLKENRFNFEWSASSQFMGLNLTESQIFGICTEVILRTFKIPYRNSGCFSCIRVVKPHSSFLNTKYPAPMMRGNQEGLDLIQTVVEAALSQLPKNQF